uniref:Secreted protein n=1 Tax=Haemonchus contortus TaxID=6289 RepID=A0A7I5E7M0_HAECO
MSIVGYQPDVAVINWSTMITLATVFVSSVIVETEGRSLQEVVCDLNPTHCNSPKASSGVTRTSRRFLSTARNHAAPSASELARWHNYEREAAGTGLISDAGPGWGPGFGNVNIATALGIQAPVGSLAIHRDFDLGFGGSGRSGGRSFGFGNGYQKQIGSAPWAWP